MLESQSSFGVELEARLALAEITAEAGDLAEARRILDEVGREATARGWNLVADKAAAVEQRIDIDSRRLNQFRRELVSLVSVGCSGIDS